MKLKYIAHSCFALTFNNGAAIVCDPYAEDIGYRLPRLKCDAVTVSHEHFDHNAAGGVDAKRLIAPDCPSAEVNGCRIEGFICDHDDCGGKKRGKTTAFRFSEGGVSLLHLGDICAMPDEAFFEAIGDIDILLVPVGGFFTVDCYGALALCRRIAPRLIVPMHYATERGTIGEIGPVSDFARVAKELGGVEYAGGSELEYQKAQHTGTKTVILELSAEPVK